MILYLQVLDVISEIIGVSCSGRHFKTLEQRADVLNMDVDLRPDMASPTVSSLNISRQASVHLAHSDHANTHDDAVNFHPTCF